MIRAIARLLCKHEWRGIYLPRYYDHQYKGLSDCPKCGATKRHKRPTTTQAMREILYALNDIERGHTLEKARRLNDALDDAAAILQIAAWEIGAKAQPGTTQGDAS